MSILSAEHESEERELLHLLRTEPKPIKVRHAELNEDGTVLCDDQGKPIFIESSRQCNVVNFSTDIRREFILISHVKDTAEGKPLQPFSGLYLDWRGLQEGRLLTLVGRVLARVPLEPRPDYFVGIPKTGLAIARSLSQATFNLSPQSGIPSLDVIKKIKLPDEVDQIDAADNAPLGHGERVWLVDDVLSKGTSASPSFRLVESLGYQPVGLLVTVDRQQGGTERLERMGRLTAYWKTAEELLNHYLHQMDETAITQDQFTWALDSLKRDRLA